MNQQTAAELLRQIIRSGFADGFRIGDVANELQRGIWAKNLQMLTGAGLVSVKGEGVYEISKSGLRLYDRHFP